MCCNGGGYCEVFPFGGGCCLTSSGLSCCGQGTTCVDGACRPCPFGDPCQARP
jgi:hypothetical protein